MQKVEKPPKSASSSQMTKGCLPLTEDWIYCIFLIVNNGKG